MSTSLRHIANMQRDMWSARRWARAWKRKASGEGKSGFVRLLVKRDRKQKARIAELEEALRPSAPQLGQRGVHDVAFWTLICHPAPWKIDQDWTIEVYGSDGSLVAKPSSMENAVALVEWAARETKEMDETIAEMTREADSDFRHPDAVVQPEKKEG